MTGALNQDIIKFIIFDLIMLFLKISKLNISKNPAFEPKDRVMQPKLIIIQLYF